MTKAEELIAQVRAVEKIRINGNQLTEMDEMRVADAMKTFDVDILMLRVFRGGGFRVIVTVDNTHHGPLIHASISHRARFPTWGEISELRHTVWSEDEDAIMVMPRLSDYVNIHDNAFHLWSAPTAWGIQ